VRIGLDRAYALEQVDEFTIAAITRTIAILKDAGAEIVEVKIPDVRPHLEKATAACLSEAAISHAANYPAHKETYSSTYAALLDTGRATSVLDYAAITIWRREFAGALRLIFERVDCLIAPVLPSEAPSLAMMDAMAGAPPLSAAPLMAYTIPFNLAGVPSLTLPMGRTPSGTPMGFQLIGPERGEAKLISAGAVYEKVLGPQGHPAI
jgi:amidase